MRRNVDATKAQAVVGATGAPTRPALSSTDDDRSQFRREQLDLVQRHVVRAAFINSTLAVLLAQFLAPTIGATPVHVWIGLKLAVSVARATLAIVYMKSPAFSRRNEMARAWVLVLLFVDGGVWGAAGAWCAFSSSEIACLTCAVLCSVTLMATHGFHAMATATWNYASSMLMPLAVAAVFRGDAIGLFVAMGTVLVLLQAIVTSLASEKRLKAEFDARQANEVSRQREVRHGEQLATALLEVKRQSAVKALFLGTMSHELRTPLHGILGLTQLIRKQTSGDPVVQHRLGLVETSGTHLLELISALLDVSRIESGKLVLHAVSFDLAAELKNITDLYRLRCESKGLDFRCLIEFESPCLVIGDAARIRQVLHNLLGNAVKFTKSGLVVLKAHRTDDRYTFEVRDTGPGISAKDMAHIFDAFEQADDSATRPADGTGLGLTIARELAQAMRGDITVSSAVGVGSQFAFHAVLPSAPALPAAPKVAESRLPQLRNGYTVVIVEDNEVNALIATAVLQGLGANVLRASDGEQGIAAAFATPRPDFIFMDCRMPIMDGFTATREIRTIERKLDLHSIPIVALTASPTDEDRHDCFQAGMNDVLKKPFTSEQLFQVISLYSAGVDNRDHPLYEYAQSLDDSEPDLLDGPAMH